MCSVTVTAGADLQWQPVADRCRLNMVNLAYRELDHDTKQENGHYFRGLVDYL